MTDDAAAGAGVVLATSCCCCLGDEDADNANGADVATEVLLREDAAHEGG